VEKRLNSDSEESDRVGSGNKPGWVRRVLRLIFRPPSKERSDGKKSKPGSNLLGLGVLVLCLGIPLSSFGGRALGGFDFKIAEFAPIAIGAGFARLLAGFGLERGKALWFSGTKFSGLGHFFVTFRITAWVLALFVLCLMTYGGRGDLGPLMVIIPALLCTMLVWVSPWRVGPLEGGASGAQLSLDEKRGFRTRALAWTFCFGSVVLAFRLSKAAVGALNDWLIALPIGGETIVRAVERFDTFGTPWFTETGQWTTSALWISAGYFGHGDPMHWLSNLHSDLAFVATFQIWGNLGNFLILMLFALLSLALLRLGDRLLHRAGWLYRHCEAAEFDGFAGADFYEKNNTMQRIQAATHEGAIAGYYLLFSGFYLASEVFVHVGTCFNTIPQTGVTIPWLSSGGSAALAFSILLATALATHIKGRRDLKRALDWIGDRP
jgi:cell division protein FtsW (lipid II flippase)